MHIAKTNGASMDLPIDRLATPCLLLERETMLRNIDRLKQRLSGFGVSLRPHLKTCKSVEVARLLLDYPHTMATVSTLKEAEIFAEAGVQDIIYAVGIAPDKLSRALAIREKGCDLSVVVDSVAQAQAIAAFAKAASTGLSVLVEVDSDGQRAGVSPNDAATLGAIAVALDAGGCSLKGVLTHAGASYQARTPGELHAIAEQERSAAVRAAQALRERGFACPVVSVGSTPTAHFAQNLTGVTEVRAGVFVFFDLVMAGIGVCVIPDIAISVLATVIGHQRERGWIIVDAGWMAMSRDRGTAGQALDCGYGLACDIDGKPIPDLVMVAANQEHGVLAMRADSLQILPDLPVGTQFRILPNHACATVAQHEAYHVVERGRIIDQWPIFRGW